MKWCPLACVFWALIVTGCGPREDASPSALYDAASSRMPAGIVASLRVDLERFAYARLMGFDLGDAAVLHLFELDWSAGGGEAAVLSGPGAAELEDMLLERGFITRVDGAGTIVIGSGANEASSATDVAIGIFASRPLRRFERDGRIVFSPTVDMKHDLLDLDAHSAGLDEHPELALAFDGRRLSRMLRSRLENALGPMGQIAGAELARRTRGRRPSTSPMDMGLDVVAGVRYGHVTYSASRGRMRLVPDKNSVLGAFASALREIDGEWPLFDEGGLKLVAAVDAMQLREADDEWGFGLDATWWGGRIAGVVEVGSMAVTRAAASMAPGAVQPTDASWSGLPLFGGENSGKGSTLRGWWLRPEPPERLRWGTWSVEPGTFLQVRDGKIPSEQARTILTGRRAADGTIEFDWFGLTS